MIKTLNIIIRRNLSNDDNSSQQVYDFILKTQKYGKVVIDRTESITINGAITPEYNNSWNNDGKLYIGSGSNFETNKIPIVRANPIAKAPYTWDAVNKITEIKKNVAINSPIKIPRRFIYNNIIKLFQEF